MQWFPEWIRSGVLRQFPKGARQRFEGDDSLLEAEDMADVVGELPGVGTYIENHTDAASR